MITFTRRHVAIGTLTLALSLGAVIAGLTTSSQQVQAQPNPSMMAQQPPASCACAAPVPVFGSSGGPQIAHCQCGPLSCAAATSAGGVALHCAR
jgi:hypothetical protein